jgi:hypothetical protein
MTDTAGLSATFIQNLPKSMEVGDSYAELLLLREYGAIFVARGRAKPPDRVVFTNAEEVDRFQRTLDVMEASIGDLKLELQTPAMNGLIQAVAAAETHDLTITPRGQDSARRSYGETEELWASRVDPALRHWAEKGRITEAQADRVRSLPPSEQVHEVLELEQDGIWFAKDLSKSIIYSVAPPGTSQHLSMLAFDVREHEDPTVRTFLANYGWYQTVTSDLPHFTFLGVPESELPALGLKKIHASDRTFWIPE